MMNRREIDGGADATLQSAQAAAADGESCPLLGCRYLTVQITGTYTGITANFEGTLDGVTWAAVALTPAATGTSPAATATANGLYYLAGNALMRAFRARTTVAAPTGSMTIVARRMA